MIEERGLLQRALHKRLQQLPDMEMQVIRNTLRTLTTGNENQPLLCVLLLIFVEAIDTFIHSSIDQSKELPRICEINKLVNIQFIWYARWRTLIINHVVLLSRVKIVLLVPVIINTVNI